ncbi:MAG: glutathione binding-like protein [Maricaulaceae bacterium]
MFEVYFWITPNGYKVTVFLEEAGLDYTLIPVDIGKGDQFAPDFLKISPNNKIPALVDPAPETGEGPLSVFESGAILLYLAEKTGRFLPQDRRQRTATLEWLFWQMGGFGPMLGQNHHFGRYAPEPIPYAIDRYVNESKRLYKVLDNRLAQSTFVAGPDYTIADMAVYPWVVPHPRQRLDIADYPHVQAWFEDIGARPAVKRAYARGQAVHNGPVVTDDNKSVLFGQSAPENPQA